MYVENPHKSGDFEYNKKNSEIRVDTFKNFKMYKMRNENRRIRK